MMDVASASVINENTQINFKGSTCQKSMLMKCCISNAWVMVGVLIMITMMNHVETPNKRSDFLAPNERERKKKEDKLWVSKHLSACVRCHFHHINKSHVIFNSRSGSTQMRYLRTQESQNLLFNTQLWELVPSRSSLGCWGWVEMITLETLKRHYYYIMILTVFSTTITSTTLTTIHGSSDLLIFSILSFGFDVLFRQIKSVSLDSVNLWWCFS